MKQRSPSNFTPKDAWTWCVDQYRQLSAKEQLGLQGLASLVALGLLWLVTGLPIQQLGSNTAQEKAKLELQRQALTLLQAQAQTIRAQTRMNQEDAKKALEKITKIWLPQAQLSPSEDAIQITFSAVSASTLAHWLVELRESAQCTIVQADLSRSSTSALGAPGLPTSSSKTSVLWQGRLTVGLPH